MLEAATEFRKNGFNDDDAAQLAVVASQLQNVADEAISAEDSASFLIAQMTAFDIPAENAQHIADAVNEVANQFSVSSGDISNSLGNMSAVMAQTGASFEESLGMLTAITEVTRNANKASRGLVSIGSRIVQVVDDSSTTGKALKEIYDELGIALFDSEGQLRSSYDIFYDLSQIWDTLDTNTQNYIASVQAGTNQFQNFAALMQNFGHATEATSTALNSAGSAAKENEKAVDSLEGHTNQLRATFQELANNVIESDLVKALLDAANGFLELLNKIDPTIIQFGLLTTALTGVFSIAGPSFLTPILNQLGSAFGVVGTTAAQAAKGATQASGAFGGLLSGISKLGPKALLVAGVVSAIVIALVKLKKAWDDAHPSLEEVNQQIEESNAQLATNQERLEALYEIPYRNLTPELREEISALEEANAELKDFIDNRKQLQAEMEYEELQEKYATPEEVRYTGLTSKDATQALQLEYGLAAGAQYDWKTLKKEMEEMGIAFDKNVTSAYAFEDALKAMGISFTTVEYGAKDFDNSLQDIQDEYNYYIQLMQSGVELTVEQRDRFVELANDVIPDLNQGLKSARNSEQELTDAGYDFIQWSENAISNSNEFINKAYGVSESLSGVEMALVDAMAGLKINADQVDILKAKYPELEFELDELTGMYYLNEEALIENANQHEEWGKSIVNTTLQAVRTAIKIQQDYYNSLAKSELRGSYQRYLSGELSRAEYDAIKAQAKTYLDTIDEYKMLEYKLKSYAEHGFPDLGTDGEKESFGGGGGGGTSSSAKVLTEEEKLQAKIDATNEAFENRADILEHDLFLLQKNNAPLNEQIDKLNELQDLAHNYAQIFRAMGLSEDSEAIRNLQQIWWQYQDDKLSLLEEEKQKNRDNLDAMIQDVEDYISDRQELDDIGAAEELQIWTELLKDIDDLYAQGLVDYEYYMEQRKIITQNQAKLEKQIWDEFWTEEEERWNEEHEKEIEKYEAQKDALEALFGIMSENIDKEIEALEKEKTEIEDRYQDQIDSLNKVNEELEDQIALEQALDALAQARSQKVMVYKDGRFQYVSDADAVSEAASSLEEVQREQALKDEIAALEDSRDAEIKAIDDKIAKWEEYKEAWSNALSDYEKAQNEILIQEQLGMDLSGENWKNYLDQVEDYINQYADLMETLKNLSSQTWEDVSKDPGEYIEGAIGGAIHDNAMDIGSDIATDIAQGIIIGGPVGGVIGGAIGAVDSVMDTIKDRFDLGSSSSNKKPSSSSSSNKGSSSSSNKNSYKNPSNQAIADSITAQMKENSEKWHSASAEDKKKLEQANVELANKYYEELGRAPTYNSSTGKWDILEYDAAGTTSAHGGLSMVGEKGPELRVLNSGDGILPADITKNLWQWGTTKPADFLKSFSGLANMGKQAVISIQNLNLPNVQDGPGFVEYMENLANSFWRRTVQFQTSPV